MIYGYIRVSTESQDCRIAGLQDCRIAGLQDCRIAGLQDCRIAGLQMGIQPVNPVNIKRRSNNGRQKA
jgi:hypothetical protein